jgi:hypothetical protein
VVPNEALVAGSSEFIDTMNLLFPEHLGGAQRIPGAPHLASALLLVTSSDRPRGLWRH